MDFSVAIKSPTTKSFITMILMDKFMNYMNDDIQCKKKQYAQQLLPHRASVLRLSMLPYVFC